MHDWQNVGYQKQKICNDTGMCPTNCGAVELPMHFLLCTDKEMTRHRNIHYTNLKSKIQLYNTYPGISTFLMKFITQPNSLEEILQQPPQSIIDEKLWEATKEQLELREFALEKGYISKKWRETQQLWAQSTKECIDKQWTANIIT